MFNMKSGKSKNKLDGVTCYVDECKYHSKDEGCTADNICVAPKNAHSVEETGCTTFECSDDSHSKSE